MRLLAFFFAYLLFTVYSSRRHTKNLTKCSKKNRCIAIVWCLEDKRNSFISLTRDGWLLPPSPFTPFCVKEVVVTIVHYITEASSSSSWEAWCPVFSMLIVSIGHFNLSRSNSLTSKKGYSHKDRIQFQDSDQRLIHATKSSQNYWNPWSQT